MYIIRMIFKNLFNKKKESKYTSIKQHLINIENKMGNIILSENHLLNKINIKIDRLLEQNTELKSLNKLNNDELKSLFDENKDNVQKLVEYNTEIENLKMLIFNTQSKIDEALQN